MLQTSFFFNNKEMYFTTLHLKVIKMNLENIDNEKYINKYLFVYFII